MDEKRGGFSANFIALKTGMEPGNEAIYYSGVYIITQYLGYFALTVVMAKSAPLSTSSFTTSP